MKKTTRFFVIIALVIVPATVFSSIVEKPIYYEHGGINYTGFVYGSYGIDNLKYDALILTVNHG